MQRRRAVTLRRVDVGVGLEQREDGLDVAALDGVSKRGFSGGGAWSGAGSGNAKQRGEP